MLVLLYIFSFVMKKNLKIQGYLGAFGKLGSQMTQHHCEFEEVS